MKVSNLFLSTVLTIAASMGVEASTNENCIYRINPSEVLDQASTEEVVGVMEKKGFQLAQGQAPRLVLSIVEGPTYDGQGSLSHDAIYSSLSLLSDTRISSAGMKKMRISEAISMYYQIERLRRQNTSAAQRERNLKEIERLKVKSAALIQEKQHNAVIRSVKQLKSCSYYSK